MAKPKRRKCICGKNYVKSGKKYCSKCKSMRDPVPPSSFEDVAKARATEEEVFIEILRANKQLLETSDENVHLPPGVTHILLIRPGQKPKLIRKRFK